MGTYDIILKAITEEIIKCYVSLKSIKAQIESTIKEITDSQEEYDEVIDVVTHFYRDTYNSKIEMMKMMSKDNTLYENIGDEESVDLPIGVEDVSFDGDNFRYSIHSHPQNGTAFPSFQDFWCYYNTEPKFMIISNDKGIIVVKHTNEEIPMVWENMSEAFRIYDDRSDRMFRMSKDFRDLERRYSDGDYVLSEFNDETNKLYQKHMSENMDKEVRDLNVEFMSKKCPVKCFYIPLDRNNQ